MVTSDMAALREKFRKDKQEAKERLAKEKQGGGSSSKPPSQNKRKSPPAKNTSEKAPDRETKKPKHGKGKGLMTASGKSFALIDQPEKELTMPYSFMAQPNEEDTLSYFQQFPLDLDDAMIETWNDQKRLVTLTDGLGTVTTMVGRLIKDLKESRSATAKARESLVGLQQYKTKYEDLQKNYDHVVTDSIEQSEVIKDLTKERDALKKENAIYKRDYVHREKFLGSDEFVKTAQFELASSKRAITYFDYGFLGCIDQLRKGGYSEADHPFSFLDIEKAFDEAPDENAEVNDDQDDEEGHGNREQHNRGHGDGNGEQGEKEDENP